LKNDRTKYVQRNVPNNILTQSADGEIGNPVVVLVTDPSGTKFNKSNNNKGPAVGLDEDHDLESRI
jgi:hypothetical protein